MRNVPADCHALVCDGMGGTMPGVDTTNAPAATDPCALPTCDASGTVQSSPTRAGTPCNSTSGGRVCDGAGHCVQCLSASDCPAGITCAAGRCSGGCADRMKDGAETDVDCGGGACPACAIGRACAEGSDCVSGVCDGRALLCVAATCIDHVQDGTETDVDCGGACPACPNDAACSRNADCLSAQCDPQVLRCITSACNNHVRDGTETGIDCGGPACPLCGPVQDCKVNQDCQSNYCYAVGAFGGYGWCMTKTCLDGMKDGTETDRDCGGGDCQPCALGNTCVTWSDCHTFACDAITHTCVSAHCADHMVDDGETDVDCGGICAGCGSGQACDTSADCATGLTCTKTVPHVCH
jgi:hypothetical protein